MQMGQSGREQHMRRLASKLLFEVRKQGNRLTLVRSIDVPAPVRHENHPLKRPKNYSIRGNFVVCTAVETRSNVAIRRKVAQPLLSDGSTTPQLRTRVSQSLKFCLAFSSSIWKSGSL